MIASPYMTLASGRDFHFMQPSPSSICLADLAHHLSRESRWANNIEPVSFSVAQHLLITAQACRLPQSRPYALLHGAAAMVLRELSLPQKDFLEMLGAPIRAYEQRVLREAIYPAFNLPEPNAEIVRDVREADQIAFATEFRDIVMGRSDWRPEAKPLAKRIKWQPQPVIEEEYRRALEGALRPFGMVV